MKKVISLLLALLILLSGCAGTTEPAPTTQPPAQTAPAATAAVDWYQEPDVALEPLNKLSFCKTSESPEVAVLDERAVAFVTREYLNKDYTKKYTRVRLVDPYADALRTEALLEGEYSVLEHFGAEGYMALVAEDSDEILVLDKYLEEFCSFEARTREGVIGRDLRSFYYLWGSKLNCLDISTGENTIHEAAQELLLDEIWGYDPEENILLVTAFEDTYTTNLCMAAVNLDDGSYSLLYRNISSGSMAAGGILLEQHYTEERMSDVLYGHWGDPEMKILSGFLVNDLTRAGWHVPGSDYVFRFDYDSSMVDIVECRLYKLGETVEVCSLQSFLKGAKINSTRILPDGNLLALAIGSRGYQPYLICPDQLEFAADTPESTLGDPLVDNSILENYEKEPEFELPESLSDVRRKANALEQRFGITILLSNQCALAASYCDMPITTTDRAHMKNESAAISRALDDLEGVLKLYPDDFFRQFRNEAGERGILVLLVEDISADINVIGVSYAMGQWYPVAIDITSGEVRSTYFHEFWHATENRINDLNKSALDLAAWENCNPAGFRYSGNMTPSYIQDTANTYFYGKSGEEVYFVDPYGKTKAQEDRARLMEYIMATEWDAKMMLEHPALREKAQILCDAIREAFDAEGWEDVYWERFFE